MNHESSGQVNTTPSAIREKIPFSGDLAKNSNVQSYNQNVFCIDVTNGIWTWYTATWFVQERLKRGLTNGFSALKTWTQTWLMCELGDAAEMLEITRFQGENIITRKGEKKTTEWLWIKLKQCNVTLQSISVHTGKLLPKTVCNSPFPCSALTRNPK